MRLPLAALIFMATMLSAQPESLNLSAKDNPNDRGHAVLLEWKSGSSDIAGADLSYSVWRADYRGELAPTEHHWTRIGSRSAAGAPGKSIQFIDVSEDLHNGEFYLYRLDEEEDGESRSHYLGMPAAPMAQWFNANRWNMLLAVLVLGGAILYWIRRGQRGDDINLRPVAGLEAFDEAVGRATEMGQPVLFVPGIMDMDQIETLSGVSILGYVGKMTARYETPLEVPVSRSLVMAHSREVLRESYLSEGRPDLFHEDMVHYLTDDQFAYAAAVDGIMLREKPAACFYQGKFYAESLILAETGNSIGAIQIAGTASPSQLPFFITACDYTLIGEEFFAASAYLSRDKKLMGSIRGQDVAKVIFMTALILGLLHTILISAGLKLPSWLDPSALFQVSGG
ncbi:MAG: hypothetical protein QF492_01120 [Candidatus Krumholzibacteria bacterium]|jgi:hypothetical protein|nr:hypothetical protein [Candidatus Krumholzibacteria bacterium]MDP6668494.1 hypothetical protein [Candidatus Krumholzibacteria bacterium]MDP6797528.1 hypothetical protein [Candidatus Krumholzibacteria bacterium]MDP7021375.1 hypothetical protein [Candidatus Krumholzibacteria bacterium]